MDYLNFIAQKTQSGANTGFSPLWMPPQAFDFQQAMIDWALWKGRGALLEDCGLGKSMQFLTWAQNVVMHTNRPVLVLTPLAVAAQTIREADKFGIEAHRSNDGKVNGKIVVTNYEKLHLFDSSDFAGVVCDESSRIKSADSATRQEVAEFMRKIPYRLLATATAAPNDYLELGTSSEALGYLGFTDMLNRFFKNDNNNTTMRRMYGEAPKWRFRGHAELPFWQWVCSWARAMRKPSDLGFDDRNFILPPLIENEHLVVSDNPPEGMLFALPAGDLREQREERKRTIIERCEKVAELVNHSKPALVWCHLNEEGDTLEKMINGCVQVSGKDSDEKKEEKMMAFTDGQARVLVTKQKIAGWGMNWQHCDHMALFPSHSYEQLYQGVRRCWRFGQKNPVTVDIVTTEGERKVMANLQRKAKAADKMFSNLVAQMNNAMGIEKENRITKSMTIPAWLNGGN